MFPSFKNKKDREQKLQAYLAEIQLNNAIDNAKQEMYSNTVWASDVASKSISSFPSKQAVPSLNQSSLTKEDLKEVLMTVMSSDSKKSLDPPAKSSVTVDTQTETPDLTSSLTQTSTPEGIASATQTATPEATTSATQTDEVKNEPIQMVMTPAEIEEEAKIRMRLYLDKYPDLEMEKVELVDKLGKRMQGSVPAIQNRHMPNEKLIIAQKNSIGTKKRRLAGMEEETNERITIVKSERDENYVDWSASLIKLEEKATEKGWFLDQLLRPESQSNVSVASDMSSISNVSKGSLHLSDLVDDRQPKDKTIDFIAYKVKIGEPITIIPISKTGNELTTYVITEDGELRIRKSKTGKLVRRDSDIYGTIDWKTTFETQVAPLIKAMNEEKDHKYAMELINKGLQNVHINSDYSGSDRASITSNDNDEYHGQEREQVYLWIKFLISKGLYNESNEQYLVYPYFNKPRNSKLPDYGNLVYMKDDFKLYPVTKKGNEFNPFSGQKIALNDVDWIAVYNKFVKPYKKTFKHEYNAYLDDFATSMGLKESKRSLHLSDLIDNRDYKTKIIDFMKFEKAKGTPVEIYLQNADTVKFIPNEYSFLESDVFVNNKTNYAYNKNQSGNGGYQFTYPNMQPNWEMMYQQQVKPKIDALTEERNHEYAIDLLRSQLSKIKIKDEYDGPDKPAIIYTKDLVDTRNDKQKITNFLRFSPSSIIFVQDRNNKLHNRFKFTLSGEYYDTREMTTVGDSNISHLHRNGVWPDLTVMYERQVKPKIDAFTPEEDNKYAVWLLENKTPGVQLRSDFYDSNASMSSSTPMIGVGFSKRIRTGLRGGSRATMGTLNREFLYRPMGSKYVSLKALGEGFLSIKHPSGGAVGRRVALSNDAMELIKDYIFDNRFSMDKYDELCQQDKELIYDVFKVCKLLPTFRYPLKNPYENKNYEFELDKLVGELRVGNQNPRNKEELRRLASYMVENNLLSQSKLKSIMPLLV